MAVTRLSQQQAASQSWQLPAYLPPLKGASEASWGQLSPEGHGWVSLSLCETTVFGSSSTKNWEKKKKKRTHTPSCHLESQSTQAKTCVPYVHSCGAQGRRRQPICPVCCVPLTRPRVGC